MYIPNANREDDRDTLLAFMRAHNFATLVSQVEGAPFATHLPVTLAVEGDALVCYGHFAKANPQWRTLGGQTALLMFGGPHAYVSPQWYEKAENVPTWNYMAVHAYGTARLMDSTTEREAVLSVIADLIGQQEPSYQAQWDSLSDKYRDGMLQGIVGFVLTVERLEGKYKLSQNRTPTDQTTVADHLLASPDSSASAIGAAMRAKLDQHG